jgi:hypothetical protein
MSDFYKKLLAEDADSALTEPRIAPDETSIAPDWADVPGLMQENFAESGKQMASDLWQMVRHPVETVTAVADLGKGVASKLIPGLELDESAADAFGEFIVKRYGGDEGDAFAGLRRTLASDPAGAVSDLSAFFTGGGMAVAKASGIVRKGARVVADAASRPLVLPQINRQLNFPGVSPVAGAVATGAEKIAQGGQAVADAAKFADPMYLALRGGGEAAKFGAKKSGVQNLAAFAPSILSGTGAAPILQAVKSGFEGGEQGRAFRDFMRGEGSVKELVQNARDGLAAMRAERNAHYKQNIAPITKDATVLDYSAVDEALGNAIADNTLRGKTKSAEAQTALNKIKETVAEFRVEDPALWHTVEGMDFLKQRIGSLIDFNNKHADANRATQSMYHAVADIIKKQAPDYAEVMSDYSKATDEINEINRALSLKDTATVDTASRKLSSIMRNNANTNYGARAAHLDTLEAASKKPLASSVAGQAMSSWEPRGLARGTSFLGGTAAAAYFADKPWLLGILPASSPRIIGETGHAVGRLAGLAAKTGADYRPAAITSTGVIERADEENKRKLLEALLGKSPYESIRN